MPIWHGPSGPAWNTPRPAAGYWPRHCFRWAASSEPILKAPDIQVVLTPALLLQASMGEQPIRAILKAPHGFLVALNLGTPHSRGEVTLRSANPNDRPAIQANYFG